MTAPDTDWTERWREVEGQHWVTVAERCGAMAGGFGEPMLDAADRKAGERVLDVGCENGATRVEAARRVRRRRRRGRYRSFRSDAWPLSANVPPRGLERGLVGQRGR